MKELVCFTFMREAKLKGGMGETAFVKSPSNYRIIGHIDIPYIDVFFIAFCLFQAVPKAQESFSSSPAPTATRKSISGPSPSMCRRKR
jgi:hypothetical protein